LLRAHLTLARIDALKIRERARTCLFRCQQRLHGHRVVATSRTRIEVTLGEHRDLQVERRTQWLHEARAQLRICTLYSQFFRQAERRVHICEGLVACAALAMEASENEPCIERFRGRLQLAESA